MVQEENTCIQTTYTKTRSKVSIRSMSETQNEATHRLLTEFDDVADDLKAHHRNTKLSTFYIVSNLNDGDVIHINRASRPEIRLRSQTTVRLLMVPIDQSITDGTDPEG